MFWALSKYFSQVSSIAGAVVYLFLPYRFVDLYVRGSLGENTAFAVAPLLIGSIFSFSKGKKIYLPALAISTALLIIAHNVIINVPNVQHHLIVLCVPGYKDQQQFQTVCKI